MNTSRRSILKWSAGALAASPVIGGLTLALTTPSAVQKQRDAARQEGLALTPEDLRPQPPVREEDNAALRLQELTHYIKAEPKRGFDPWDKAATDLIKDPSNEKAKAVFQAGLTRYAKWVTLAEEAATLPHCDFNYDFSQGTYLELPELATFRQFARIFTARAVLATDRQAAFADIARAAKLGNLVAETPILIAALVFSAVHTIVHKGYCTLLKRFGPSPLAQDTLSAFGPAPLPAFYLRSEVVMGLVTIQQLREGKLRKSPDETPETVPFTRLDSLLKNTFLGPVLLPQWEHQFRLYWREVYAKLHTTNGDYRTLPEQLDRQGKRWENDKIHLPQNLLVVILTPVLSGAITATNLKQEAQRRLRASALMLLKEKAVQGQFPEAPTLPTDPFSGTPLRYKKDGEGCLVYSIGSDHKDDGGVERSKQNNTPLDIIVRL